MNREMVPGVIVQFECREKLKGKLFSRESKCQHCGANETQHYCVTCSMLFGEPTVHSIVVPQRSGSCRHTSMFCLRVPRVTEFR